MLPDFKKESEVQERRHLGSRFLETKLTYLAAGDDNVIPDPKSEKVLKH